MNTQGGRDDFGRLLGAPGLYAARDPAGTECPSPETMGAFADHTLTAEARTHCEAHVASCERCQHVLATMLRAVDADATVAPGRVEKVRRGWLWWAAPGGLAAAAAVAWLVVRPATPPLLAPSAEPESTLANRDVVTPKAPTMEPGPVSPVGTEARVKGVVTSAGDEAPSREVAAKAQPAEADVPALLAKRERRADVAAVEETVTRTGAPPAEPAAAGAALPAPAAPVVAQQEKAIVAPPALRPPLQSRPAATSPVPPDARAPVADATRNEARTAPTHRATFVVPIVIVTPDSDTRWRIEPGGRVLRQAGPGAPFETRLDDAALDLVAGASPLPDVCWIATRQGEVLVTRDGRTWARHRVTGAAEITAIEAVSARAASVTLANGLRLTTADGGANWQPDR